MNPGDFENIFVKAGDSETMEGLGIEASGESLDRVLWLPRNITGKKWHMLGCLNSLRSKV